MRVYVASKFEEHVRAREVMSLLESWGHEITFDWGSVARPDAQKSDMDLQGVLDADALVCVFEKDLAYRGAWVEFGVALGLGKPIYVLGDAMDGKCVFLAHPSIYHGWGVFESAFNPAGWATGEEQ